MTRRPYSDPALVRDGVRTADEDECDDCHRTDGTHDPEVEH